jgi:hypothetical protein
LWMLLWGCSSPATYFQPSAAGFIFADLRSELYPYLTLQALFYLVFSWMHASFVFSSIQPYMPVAIAVFFYYLEFAWGGGPSPLSKHTGGSGATPAFSSQLVYLQFPWGVPLPPLQWSMPHFSHCHKLSPLQGCWVGATTPSANLFIYTSSEECPSPTLWSSGHPASLLHVCFFQPLVYYSGFFSLFSLGRGQSVQEAMLIWPRVVCCLSHLVVCFFQAG